MYGSMNQNFTLKIGDHLQSADKKRYYNEKVFTEIAPRYDFITRALSFGCDASWKKDLIASLPGHEAPVCLDIACGTGDIAFLLAEKYQDGRIFGLDITESMLALARMRNVYPQVAFDRQDMVNLDFPSESVDIITGGYALRNAPDLMIAIEEIHRVLKPGGIAAFLDFSKPNDPFIQKLEYWLLKIWAGFWGLLFHRNHEVYSYIAESLKAYPKRARLRRMLRGNGFRIISSRLYFLGITQLLVIQKLPSQASPS